MVKYTYFRSMQSFVHYKNSKVYYSVSGKGPAVVLLHGFLENSSMWLFISDRLSKNHNVINIDLLGHGKSECIGYVHTMEDIAHTVKEVLKQLHLNKVTIIGHSLGGYVALAFAEYYSDSINGLCLLNSTAQADSEDRKKIRARAIQMAKQNYTALVSMSISNLFTSKSRTLFSKEIEELRTEALETPLQGYLATIEGMILRKNRETILKKIPKRLHIIGENDPILDYNTILKEAQRTETPVTKLTSGHMSYIEDKEALTEVLIDFLKTNKA